VARIQKIRKRSQKNVIKGILGKIGKKMNVKTKIIFFNF
jgi:hypothetical protein